VSDIIHTYKSLRKTIGFIGILLPFVLMVGGFCQSVEFQASISDYYYTNMGDVFVGALCCVGLFLFFYAGYDKTDDILGNIAGIFAFGVAFFPTSQNDKVEIIGTIHIICATLLFIILAVFSLVLFTKGDKSNSQKVRRNIVYRICGIMMVLSIISLFIYFLVPKNSPGHFVFFAESTALVFFGISWLTKGGDLFFPDKTKRVRPYKRLKYLKR